MAARIRHLALCTEKVVDWTLVKEVSASLKAK